MDSKSSRLTVKGCNQTRMPCVGSSLFISLAGSSVDLDVEDKLLLDYDDSLDTTRNTELSIVQVIVFPILAESQSFAVFHSYEYPRFEQS